MQAADEPATLSIGQLRVDLGGYTARIGERVLHLSRTELEVLALLITNPHRVLAREDVARHVGLARARSVDVVLTRLRRALGRPFVRNVRSRGWIVDAEQLQA